MNIDKKIIKGIKSAASHTDKFSKIVNLRKYNTALHLNLYRLDIRSQNFYVLRPDKSFDVLNKINVYFGVKKAKNIIQDFLKSLDLDPSFIDEIDAFTLGNDIFVLYDKPAKLDDSDIRLLGHEAIHSLQYEAIPTFLEEYFSVAYDTKNEFEVAAYRFGGNADAIGLVLKEEQVFKETKIV